MRYILYAILAYIIVWIGAWLWCFMNSNGQSQLPEDMQ